MTGWSLPTRAVFGGKTYQLHADYRDILEIFSYLNDPDLPEYLRWSIALALFYDDPVPGEHQQEAMEYLARFISGGEAETAAPGPKLIDWEQDSAMIVADVNKAAGQEIRALPFVHWWTFLSWFHAIGQGQLSTVVSIRDKMARGKKLEDWEKTFYRENKHKVELKKRYSQQELQTRQQLELLLEGR